MDIKLDFPGSIKRAIDVTTKLAQFWKTEESEGEGEATSQFPTNIGPALSHLLVIGLLPLISSFLGGLIFWSNWQYGGIFARYVIFMPILTYIFFVGMPVLTGYILGALDPGLNINKGKNTDYVWLLAMAASPAALGAAVSWIPWVGWIFGLVAWLLSIVVTYIAFTEGLKAESGQAIILMVIMVVIYIIVWAIIFTLILGMIFGGLGGPMGNPGWWR